MSKYKENPKTKNSGVICCIPQSTVCPQKCPDCFFQSGRSYLEPLDKNLPNIPTDAEGRIVRINDGNDSNVERSIVELTASKYSDYFFNTSIPEELDKFSAPVVFTCNPGEMTNKTFIKLKYVPHNLMFVRFRCNTWNKGLIANAVPYYSKLGIRVVITFMAYYNEKLPEEEEQFYTTEVRTTNVYWVMGDRSRRYIEGWFVGNPLVYTCGHKGTHECHRCGNCIREFYRVKEEMRG